MEGGGSSGGIDAELGIDGDRSRSVVTPFTFDHVYGSTDASSVAMLDECVALLVEGLFKRYNATVLAYDQTGTGKMYTTGTACKEGSYIGVISRAMDAMFEKIESLKSQVEFQLRVSFIEAYKSRKSVLIRQVSTST